MWQNTAKTMTPATTAIANTVANQTLANAGSTIGEAMNVGQVRNIVQNLRNIGQSGQASAAVNAGSKAIGAAGTAVGAIGSAYGLANMAIDFAHNKDHRSVANMWDTVNTNTYTTDKGNTYNEYSAPNMQAELDYARAQKIGKNVNNTVGAIGTGASIGTTLGSIVPGLGNLVGGLIGSGVGALYGLGSWLFGFGDTYEDTVNEFKKTQDVASLKSL
jgi:hypothetical protein